MPDKQRRALDTAIFSAKALKSRSLEDAHHLLINPSQLRDIFIMELLFVST